MHVTIPLECERTVDPRYACIRRAKDAAGRVKAAEQFIAKHNTGVRRRDLLKGYVRESILLYEELMLTPAREFEELRALYGALASEIDQHLIEARRPVIRRVLGLFAITSKPVIANWLVGETASFSNGRYTSELLRNHLRILSRINLEVLGQALAVKKESVLDNPALLSLVVGWWTSKIITETKRKSDELEILCFVRRLFDQARS